MRKPYSVNSKYLRGSFPTSDKKIQRIRNLLRNPQGYKLYLLYLFYLFLLLIININVM